MIEFNEKEMISAIVSGNKDAEKRFIEYYFHKVKLIVDVRMRNREDKQEIVNDILVAAIVKIRDGNYIVSETSDLTKYVHGIARNVINQYYKDHYSRAEKESKVEITIKDSLNSGDFGVLTYEEAEQIELKQKIWENSISKLKPKYRKVIYLKYYENLSIGEIGDIMKISNQKVSDYLKYSKQLLNRDLRKKIKKYFP